MVNFALVIGTGSEGILLMCILFIYTLISNVQPEVIYNEISVKEINRKIIRILENYILRILERSLAEIFKTLIYSSLALFLFEIF